VGFVPLHIAVNRDDPNIDIVKALVKAYPLGASIADNRGRLPIHYAVSRGEPCVDIVKLLLKAHPACIRTVDNDGKLPIHILLDFPSPNFDVVKLLTDNYPNSLKASSLTTTSWLPLHQVLSHYPPPFKIIRHVMESEKSAVSVAENLHGYLPLNMAINLLFLAQQQRNDVGGLDDQNAHKILLLHPKIDVQICDTTEELNHAEIAAFLDSLIIRLLDIHRPAASHRTLINWLPLHYLLLHKFPASLPLFLQLIQANPGDIIH